MIHTDRNPVVLVVDDSDEIRRTIKDLLRKVGARVCECSDGSEAVEMYRRNRPHWVLMDIRMSCMDGITATRTIRESFPDARIAIISNYDDRILRKQAEEAGAKYFVPKDDLSVLPAIVSSML